MDELRLSLLYPRDDSDNGASRGQRALVVTSFLTGLSILVVLMRFYARIGLMKIMGREDYTVLIALVFAIVYLALVVSQVHHGLGIHNDALPAAELKQQLKRLWAAIPMYNASLAFSKFSILFQYLRIFPNRNFRLACYVCMAIVATYSTWAIVSGYVNCVPVARFWDRTIAGSCLNFEAVWFFNAAMNIATDVALMILPMPVLSQLQLPRMQKIALMCVFAVGIVVVITSILRLSALRTVARSTDTSWSNVDAAYWTAAECNVAIICSCLPFLRPIISKIFPRFLSTNSYHRRAGPTTTGFTGTRSQRRHTELYSQDPDREDPDPSRDASRYSSMKGGAASPYKTEMGGIEMTTVIVQESTTKGEESGERGLLKPR